MAREIEDDISYTIYSPKERINKHYKDIRVQVNAVEVQNYKETGVNLSLSEIYINEWMEQYLVDGSVRATPSLEEYLKKKLGMEEDEKNEKTETGHRDPNWICKLCGDKLSTQYIDYCTQCVDDYNISEDADYFTLKERDDFWKQKREHFLKRPLFEEKAFFEERKERELEKRYELLNNEMEFETIVRRLPLVNIVFDQNYMEQI